MTYVEALAALAPRVIRSVHRSHPNVRLAFGGPTAVPEKIRAPTHADSKFQAEQALGDWAEGALAAAINRRNRRCKAVHYGFSSKTIAGEPGFADAYRAGILDTSTYGKRPDLLILPHDVECSKDISHEPTRGLADLVRRSIGAVEVRSSRHESRKHAAYKAAKRKAGETSDEDCSSFTVKIEDLMKVYRWVEIHQKPQLYAQVFLDDVYAINVLSIMDIIARADRLTVIEPKRSDKVTIMIPVSRGRLVVSVTQYPTLEVIDRVTASGRHDMFVKPTAGRITLAGDDLEQMLAVTT